MLKKLYFHLTEIEKLGKNMKTGYNGNGGTFQRYEDFYGSFTSKLKYTEQKKRKVSF